MARRWRCFQNVSAHTSTNGEESVRPSRSPRANGNAAFEVEGLYLLVKATHYKNDALSFGFQSYLGQCCVVLAQVKVDVYHKPSFSIDHYHKPIDMVRYKARSYAIIDIANNVALGIIYDIISHLTFDLCKMGLIFVLLRGCATFILIFLLYWYRMKMGEHVCCEWCLGPLWQGLVCLVEHICYHLQIRVFQFHHNT